ncbi:hypothetical protein MPER_14520, partial [Moniliophthora perniciosa FA553]
TYVVKSEDTCNTIVANHGIDMTLLLANNPQINDDCTNIYNGEGQFLTKYPSIPFLL